MDRLTEFQHHEREARRLRAEYANDLMVRAVLALDLAIRRAAHGVLAWLAWAVHASQARAERGGYG